ncbi:MAG: SulP family inorganic anion transporter [Polyangiales bacterium]
MNDNSDTRPNAFSLRNAPRDFAAGIAVYLVALPLCLGIALASDAPLAAGLISGIVGGIGVGLLSGSHTSISGPAAALAAVVAVLIAEIGSFQGFLVAVVIAGLIQIALGLLRAGFVASFFPSSVIKGLMAGIGALLVLKQIPHVFGYDADPEGDMAFSQSDGANTFSELMRTVSDIHPGASLIGLVSVASLLLWNRSARLSKSVLPGALLVVLLGVSINTALGALGSGWMVDGAHLVRVPVLDGLTDGARLFAFPDWAMLSNPSVYVGAVTLALVATLVTLLNLEAVDQLDPEQRSSPPNRELIAQGTGNLIAGIIGGLPMTSVIVRSTVNINANSKSKLSALVHGLLLLGSVLLIPRLLNVIPLAALAAILLVTGLSLTSPKLFRQMWREGSQQFVPFVATATMIVITDPLTGVLVGLGIAFTFILWSNYRRPLRIVNEQHLSGEVVRIELANQVSFLNRAALERALRSVKVGAHVLLDARNTDYIDPDILDLIGDFQGKMAPAHGVSVSLLGFKSSYSQLGDQIKFIDHSTRELQSSVDPEEVVEMLEQGNARFRSGERVTRDLTRQVEATASGQAPLAVIVSCIDSRAPAEHLFDLGLGDIFSVRIAGHVARTKVLGSIEYGCKVAGSRLIVVMGHTACGAVTSAVKLMLEHKPPESTGCENLGVLIEEIQKSASSLPVPPAIDDSESLAAFVDNVARQHVLRTIDVISTESGTIAALLRDGEVEIVGAMYDVRSGQVEFIRNRHW